MISDEELERSAVVANCLMNRERRLRGYSRELGLDVAAFLGSRTRTPVRWLDLCCGSGSALLEAAATFGDEVEIVGVDLAGHFAGPADPPRLRLVTASVASWQPDGAFDLITSVHGLHYVGDKLGVIAGAARSLTVDGLFAANFDVHGVRQEDGAAAGPRLTRALRAAGLSYASRTRRIGCRGRREVELPYVYLGSDDRAGPNYTGQPAVSSHYAFTGRR